MDAPERRLLLAILALQDGHAKARPLAPAGAGRAARRSFRDALAAWHVEGEHGPHLDRLFRGDRATRAGISRALDRLEDEGLVRCWGPGLRRTHCRLTRAGEHRARILARRAGGILGVPGLSAAGPGEGEPS